MSPEGIAAEMAKAECEFASDGSFECEKCDLPIPPGDAVFFLSDGGFESRDGSYFCRACFRKYLGG